MKKRLFACLLMIAMLLTGCTGKENEKPHVASYENGQKLLAEGKYEEAALIFESLNGYEDSVLLLVYARAKDKLSKGDYQSAINGFLSIEGYRDSALAARYAGARMLSESEDGYSIVEGAEIFDGMLLYLDSADRALTAREDLYRRANAYMDAGEYAFAREDYTALGEYRDSASMEKYAYAKIFEAAGIENPMGYLRAVDAFEEVYDFKDSAERARSVLENVYKEAERLVGSGKPDEAETLFRLLAYPKTSGWTNRNRFAYLDSEKMIDYCQVLSLSASVKPKDQVYAAYRFESMGDFRDASKRAEELRKKVYDEGFNQLNAGEFQKAKEIFLLQDYEDSQMMGSYAVAAGLEKSAENEYARYADAAEAFEALGEFKDSAKRAADSRERLYTLATEALEGGLYYDAKYYFNLQADYRDSADLSRYAAITADYQASGNDDQALLNVKERYIALGNVKDSQNMVAAINEEVYLMAQNALLKNAFNRAETLFETLSGYKDSGEMVLYTQAAREENAGSVHSLMKAAEMYENMNGFSDSAQKAQEIRSRVYQEAKASLENYDFDRAIEYFDIQDYEDSGEYASYARAMKKEFSSSYRDHISAAEAFEAMNGFKDSAERAEAIRENVYKMAVTALEYRNFKNAVRLFELQDYKDSKDMIAYTRTMEMEFSSSVDDQISAAEKYEAMNGFKDSAERAKAIRENVYNTAMTLLENGNFQNAVRLFGMQDYKDSKDMIAYAKASEMEHKGEKINAVDAFLCMGDFRDASARAEGILSGMLAEAKAYEDKHEYDLASKVYASMGEHKDGTSKSKYVLSEKELYEAGDDPAKRISAAVSFENLGGIMDSAERAKAIRNEVYANAKAALEEGSYADAEYLFSLQDYEDSMTLSTYAGALKMEFRKTNADEAKIMAAQTFETIPEVLDSLERATAIRKELSGRAHEKLEAGLFEEARALFILQPEYEQNQMYADYAGARDLEVKAQEDPTKWISANEIYVNKLQGQLDADERAANCLASAYEKAWALCEDADYDQAINVFEILKDYEDSANAAKYILAEKTFSTAGDNAKAYVEAKEMYVSLGDYKDAAAAAETIDKQLFVRFVDYIGVFTKDGLARFEKNGKWGYLSTEGEVVVNAKFDMAYDFSEGLAAVKLGSKWGYIDTKGNVVIPMKYENARSFSDGMAAIVESGYWKYITPNNKRIALPSNISNSKYISYFDNGYTFVDGYYDHERYTIDKNGNSVSRFTPITFTEGIAVVQNGSAYYPTYNYMTESGEYLSDKGWTYANPFENGRGIVQSDEKYGIVDTDGNYVSNLQWDEIQPATDGIFLVKRDGNYGYIDMDGKTVSAVQWNYAYPYSDGLALVWQNGYYGFIDAKGETAIDFVYDEAQPFKDGYAFVKQYGAWKCIDTKGETVFDIDERVNKIYGSAKENRIRVSGGDGKYGYIDQSGEVVISMTLSEAADFSEGFAAVTKNNVKTYIRENGEDAFAIPNRTTFRTCQPFNGGYAIVYYINSSYSSYFALIDSNGEMISGNCNEIQRINDELFYMFISNVGYQIIDKDGNVYSNEYLNAVTLKTETKDGKTVFVSATANVKDSSRFETSSVPIDEKYRVLPRSGVDETGVFAVKQNGVWYFTDKDGEIIF